MSFALATNPQVVHAITGGGGGGGGGSSIQSPNGQVSVSCVDTGNTLQGYGATTRFQTSLELPVAFLDVRDTGTEQYCQMVSEAETATVRVKVGGNVIDDGLYVSPTQLLFNGVPVGGGGGGISAVVAGNGITVDNTTPTRPIVNNDGVTRMTFDDISLSGTVGLRASNGVAFNTINPTTQGITNTGVIGLTDGSTIVTGDITVIGSGVSVVASTSTTPSLTITNTGVTSITTKTGAGIAIDQSTGTVAIASDLTSTDGSILYTPSGTDTSIDLSVVSASNIVINPTSTDVRGIQILSNSTGASAPSINWFDQGSDVLTATPPVNVQWDTNDADPALTVQCYSNKSGGVRTAQYPITSYAGTWVSGTAYIKGSIAISPINNNAYMCSVFTDGTVDPSTATGIWVALNTTGGGGTPTSISNGGSLVSIDTNGVITSDTSTTEIGSIVLTTNGEYTAGTANLFIANSSVGTINITGNIEINSDTGGGNHVKLTSYTASVAVGDDTTNPPIVLTTASADITLTNGATEIICGLDTDTIPTTGLFVSPTRLFWNNTKIIAGGVSALSVGDIALTGDIDIVAGEGMEIVADAGTNSLTFASDPFVGDYWFTTPPTFTNTNIGTAIFDTQDPNNDNTVVSYDTTSGTFTVLKAGVYQLNWTCSVSANSAVWDSLTSAEAFISVLLDLSTQRNTSTTLFVPYPNGASSSGFRIQANCVISLNVNATFNFGLQWGASPTGSWGFNPRDNTHGLGAFASWSFIKPL